MPRLVQKDVDDELAVVEEHPAGVLKALDAAGRTAALSLHAHLDFFGDRAHLARVAPARDYEVVRDAEQLADIKHDCRVIGLRRGCPRRDQDAIEAQRDQQNLCQAQTEPRKRPPAKPATGPDASFEANLSIP